MNLNNIINAIETVDPEVYDRLDTRRSTMRRFSFIGKTLAMAAVPSAIGSMFQKAYGQTAGDVTDVLLFAYLLENLEAEFYKKVVTNFGPIGVPAGPAQGALTVIRDHEVAHVAFLKTVLQSMNATIPNYTAASFDFSGAKGAGNGPFASAFSNYGVMLAVAQTYEDTGVRAYKGQAPRLINNKTVLQAALQIHSVEARHASHIRQMRRNLTAVPNLVPTGVLLQPWITLNQSGIDTGNAGANAAIQMSYAGEEVTTQAMVNIVNIGGATISANEASEAFDEPLTKDQVTAIVNPFIV